MLQRDRDWIEEHFENLRSEIVKLRVDVATLKVKTSSLHALAGATGGVISVALMLGIKWLAT